MILWANYIEMVSPSDLTLYRFHIHVDVLSAATESNHADAPPAPTGKKLSRIIEVLLDQPAFAPFRSDMVTDFKATLLSRKKFPIETLDHQIQHRAENEDTPRTNGKLYRIRLGLLANALDIARLTEFGKSTDPNPNSTNKSDLIQALKIV